METWRPQGPRRAANGYFVPPGARLPAVRSALADCTLTIARGAVCGPVRVAGAVELRPGAACAAVAAGQGVTLASRARVAGDVRSGGRVVVQAGARVGGRIEAAADVLLLGACVVGDVRAGGDILVVGEPRTGRLEPAGRVMARDW